MKTLWWNHLFKSRANSRGIVISKGALTIKKGTKKYILIPKKTSRIRRLELVLLMVDRIEIKTMIIQMTLIDIFKIKIKKKMTYMILKQI